MKEPGRLRIHTTCWYTNLGGWNRHVGRSGCWWDDNIQMG